MWDLPLGIAKAINDAVDDIIKIVAVGLIVFGVVLTVYVIQH